MFYNATKVTVIAERLMQDQIIETLYEAGAKGHTVFDGSGQGRHHMRRGGRASVINAFSIVQIDVVFGDGDQAREVAEDIAAKYFTDYSGIVYISRVEVIRAKRF